MQALAGVQQPMVKAVIVLNEDGKRICSRFCDRKQWPDLESQRAFEMSLQRKLQSVVDFRAEAELLEFGDYIVAYKTVEDVLMFVVGGSDENELIIAEVLETLYEALQTLLRDHPYEEIMLENLMGTLLIVDELVDSEGVIMESDPAELVARVGSQGSSFMDQVPIGEQTLSQALQTARDQITRSILS